MNSISPPSQALRGHQALSLEQPLAARLNVNDLLGRVDGEDDVVVLAHEHLVLDSCYEVVERFGEIGDRKSVV